MSLNKTFTGAVENVGGGTALTFGAFAAKSILANATNGSAVPVALAGSAAFQHLRVNATNDGLEWAVITTNDIRLPGEPFYDVMAAPFNAVGDGVADDTSALNAAHAAANAAPGRIYYGPAHRITAALTPITANNVVIQGRGPFGSGTRISVDSVSAVDVFTFDSCQYSGICDLWIIGSRVYSSGYAIRLESCYKPTIRNVVISQMFNAVDIDRCTLTNIEFCNVNDTYGPEGFFAHGDNTAPCHATSMWDCSTGTPFPQGNVGPGGAWAISTAYIVGNVVFANGNLYQCVVAGTSAGAGTGPSGFPSTDPATVHTVQIVDNTVRWVFAMPLNAWFHQGSYASTFEVYDSGSLQGGYGVKVEDTDPGTDSKPLFTRVFNFQADHVFGRAVYLLHGSEARFDNLLVTSMVEGFGVEIASTYTGDWEFVGGTVFGCNKGGFLVRCGDGLIANMQIGGVSGEASNTYDCIAVENGVDNWSVVGCSGGTMQGDTTPASRYGISVASGSDNYVITGNRFIGNLTAAILNTPGLATSRIVRGNIPDDTMAAATVRGRARGAGTGLEVDLLANQVGEIIRKFNVVADSTSSGSIATYAQHTETTTQVRFTGGSTATIHGISVAADNFGQEIEFHVESGAAAKTFTNESGSAGTAGQRIRTPGGVDLVLNADESVRITYYDSRWRCGAVSKNGTSGHIIRDNGSAETQRAALNFVSSTSITAIGTDDAGSNETEVTMQLGALTGAVTSSANSLTTAFGALAAKSVLANPTNASAVPAALAGSAAFQHLRVNSTNTALEWSLLTTGDFPSNSVPITALETIATDTLLANITAGTATPTAVAFTTIDSISILWDAATHTFVLGAATGGDITRSQGSVTYTINNDAVSDAKLRNSGALSVIGRSANSAGDPADISATAASGAVLREAGSTIGFGTIATAGIADGAVTLAKQANLAAGTVIGRQVDGGTGVPVPLTGDEQGENLRRFNSQSDTTSTGTVATYAIANTATQVRFNLSTTPTLAGATATSATFGKTIEFHCESGMSGTVTFAHESGSAGAAGERFRCPGGVNLTLAANDSCIATYWDSRWRITAVSKAGIGVTDGDKGDITVSSAGTVWTVDANIAKTWTGVHSFTGASHTVDVTGAVNISADAASTITTSVGDLNLTMTDAASTVRIESRGGSGVSGGAEIRLASAIVVETTNLFRVSTGDPFVERFEIRNTGAFELSGDAGIAGQVITSQGSTVPPIWQFPRKSPTVCAWWEDFDFYQEALLSAIIFCGSTNWNFTLAGAAGGSIVFISGEANHPGIARLTTHTVSGTIACIHRGSSSSPIRRWVLGNEIRQFTAIVRTPDTSTMGFFIGFSEDPTQMVITGTANSDICGFFFDTAGAFTDTTIHCVTRESDGTATNTDTAIAPGANFRNYTIRQESVGTVEFLIDGSVVATHSTQVPDTEQMNCGLTVITRVASARTMDVDYVDFESQPLTR